MSQKMHGESLAGLGPIGAGPALGDALDGNAFGIGPASNRDLVPNKTKHPANLGDAFETVVATFIGEGLMKSLGHALAEMIPK